MNTKKFNTIPKGEAVIIILLIVLALTFVIGIILIPRVEAIGAFGFSLVFLVVVFQYFKTKHFNFISVSTEKVWHKNLVFTWDEVYITMRNLDPMVMLRNSHDYYFYFSDHYLDEDEIKSREVKKAGFYIVVTKSRVEYIMSCYEKEIKVLREGPLACSVLNVVIEHNEKIMNKK